MKYSLPVTSMTSTELHKVQSQMTASILNKLGYNCHFPHAVAFAPIHVFGCGLLDLRLEQGLAQIQSLLDYIGTDHKVGHVMLISLRQLQVEAGVSYDLLLHPKVAVPYLTECWLVCLRRFCADFDISLTVLRNRLPLLAREGDTCLMEQATKLGFKRQELVDVNLVRTFLQVTTISDIASADGGFIMRASWQGLPIADRHSRMTFARQEQPTVYQRGLWRRLLRSYLVPHASANHLQLLQPVGAWVQPSNMRWGAMMWEDNLYRRDPHHNHGERQVSIHFPQHLVTSDGVSVSRNFFDPKPDWFATHVPKLAVPADLEGEHIFTATYAAQNYPLIAAPADTFAEWVHQLPSAEKRLLSAVYFAECDAEEILVQYLQLDCTLFIGTDGGKRLHNGSFSWIIYSPGEEQLILNAGPVDGWHKCQNSHRSEATALTSVTLYRLDELATFFSLDIQCQFKLFVDSTSAISNVSQLRDLIPRRRYLNNADVFSTMSAAHPVLKQFSFQHVKSHQDDSTDFEKLSFPAQVNVLCDQMATEQLLRQQTHEQERTLPCPLTPRHLPVELAYSGQIISSHYVQRLREEISLSRHRLFLQTKYKWDDTCWENIAWESFSACAKTTRLSHAAFRSKLVHNWLHLGDQRSKFSTEVASIARNCPYCQLPEDFRHFLTCSSPRALKVRYDATAVLRKALDASPGATALFNAVQQWTSHPDDPVALPPSPRNCPGTVDSALSSQLIIGWPNLFRGFISIEWGNIVSRLDANSQEERRARALRSLAKAINSVQLYSYALWTGRNAVLHEHSESSLAIVHASLNHSISQLYSLQPSFSEILQSYFRLPLADRLRQSPRQRQRWLRLVRLATSHSSSSGTNQQLISLYFPYAVVPQAEEHPPGPMVCADTHAPSLPPTRLSSQATIRSYFPSLADVSAPSSTHALLEFVPPDSTPG